MGLDMILIDNHDKEVGYWRKANAIHGWFVRNVQDDVDDCGKYPVSREKLQELFDLCKSVLVVESGAVDAVNKKLAQEKLPPTKGFFFGMYEIGDYYIQDLKGTMEILEKVLASEDNDFYYCSSW